MRNRWVRCLSAVAIVAVGAFYVVAAGRDDATGSEPDDDTQADSGIISPTGDDPSATALWVDLAPLLGDAEVDAVPDVEGEPSNYAGLVFTPGQPAADLYWKGPMPQVVLDVIAAHPDVAVEIHDVRWNLTDLIVARDAATEFITARGYTNFLVGPMPDASGILLTFSLVPTDEADELRETVEQVTGVRAFVESDREMVSGSRQSDTNPYRVALG